MTCRPTTPFRAVPVDDQNKGDSHARGVREPDLESRPDGVLLVRIRSRQPGQAANRSLHQEMGSIWQDVAKDPDVRVALLTGDGPSFMPSVEVDTQLADAGKFPEVAGLMKESMRIVYGVINCDKPIISAINGDAGGAGLAAALLFDISIAGKDVNLIEGHLRFGVTALDHSAILWPLLCGLAKAKYHILTSVSITGAQAERIGLVSLAVDDAKVLDTALEIAGQIARGPQHALRWTKRILNHWVRQAAPIFEASLAFEAVSFFGDEHIEALEAIRDQRTPAFPWVAW